MGDAPEQQQEAIEEQKPKSSRLIFIVIGFVVIIGAIIAVSMMIIGRGSEGKELVQEITPYEPGYMYKFPEPFTGNLNYPDDEFIYSANVTLEIKPRGDSSETEALAEMGIETDSNKTKMPFIRKIIIDEISSKTRNEVTSSTGKQKIENRIKNELKNLLEKAQVENVFIEIFVN